MQNFSSINFCLPCSTVIKFVLSKSTSRTRQVQSLKEKATTFSSFGETCKQNRKK